MNGSDTIKTNNPRLDAFEWLYQIFVKQHTNLMDRSLVGTDPKVRQALEVYLAYTVVREISYLYPEHRRAIMEKLDQSLKDVTKQYESNAFIKEIFTKKTGKNIEPIFYIRDWDSSAFPYASKGFFPFKRNMSDLLVRNRVI